MEENEATSGTFVRVAVSHVLTNKMVGLDECHIGHLG